VSKPINKVILLNSIGIVGDGKGCPLVETFAEHLTENQVQLLMVTLGKQNPKAYRRLMADTNPTEEPAHSKESAAPKLEESGPDFVAIALGLSAGLVGAAAAALLGEALFPSKQTA
jgi:hypothetical protein